MTFGRLTGDRVVARAGPVLIVAGGALCAALGFALVVLGPNAVSLLGGFVLIGLAAPISCRCFTPLPASRLS